MIGLIWTEVAVMTVGDRIRKARIEKGFTLESVGDLVGVTRATIQKI
jgi:transcriptional regulator with XRE-family HTH domain